MLNPGAIRLLLLAGACSLVPAPAVAGGVVMLSGATATEARVESSLPLPDGGWIDAIALAVNARAAGARDDSTILYFTDSGFVQRLDELPPDERVVFSCLADDAEIYDSGVRALTRPAPAGLYPAAWVATGSGRLAWWPAVPTSDACGVAIAVLALTPASLSFGDVLPGDSREADAVLANIGRIALDVRTIVVEGAGFSLVQNPCNGERLAPGESCTVRVAFTPAAAGAQAGRVLMPNTGTPAQAELPLSGRGIAPASLTVDPVSLAFGSVAVGESVRRTARLSNGGEAPLVLGTAGLSGNAYAIASDPCSNATLAANAYCDVAIDFAPATAGAFDGTLSMPHGDGVATIPLAGTGTTPAPAVDAIFQSGFE